MNRRSFLRLLLASPLALTVDVEALIWTPGQQIVVPATYGLHSPFDMARVNEILKRVYLKPVQDLLNNSTVLMRYLDSDIIEIDGNSPLNVPLTWNRSTHGL